MTLRAYLRVLRERWRLVVAVLTVSVVLAIGITVATPKTYEASVQVFVSSTGNTDPVAAAQGAAFAQSQVSTYAAIVASPDVLHAVQKDLNLSISDQDLKAKISANAPAAQSLVNIHVTDADPAQAAAIANSASRAFITSVEGYVSASGTRGSAIKLFVTDPAVQPSTAVSPDLPLNVAVGILLGLLLGVSLAIVRDVLDNRIKTPEDLAKVSKLPVMGVIAEDRSTQRHVVATRAGKRNARAENFRQLRTNLQFAGVDEQARVIAVTSSVPAEGKSTIAINLASALAEAGFSVCLVDADLRRPTIATLLGLLSTVGLTSVLINQIALSEALQNVGSNLYVLTSGPIPPNPSEILGSDAVRSAIHQLREKVDFVVIDTAPLLPVADGLEVAALADGTLLVARHATTTEAQIKRSSAALQQVDASLLGLVLNRMPSKADQTYSYTYYGRDTDSPMHVRTLARPTRRSLLRRGSRSS